MRELLNKVLYGSSSPQGVSPNDGPQSLVVRPHPNDDNLLVITPASSPKDAPPLYTISKRSGNPNFALHRGFPAPENTIAVASMHISTSTVDLSVHNQPMVIKNSSMTGSWSFDTHMGKFKWKANQYTGTGFELYDRQGNKVAKYGNAGLMSFGEKQLSIYVPGDEFFTAMVLLSAVASKELARVIDEVVGEVASAVLGA
ncbi:hypothetical protein FPOAC2_02604 [Fusarium poae]|uniref:Uncharacterized protein n=1 Tax=Fusarium poae TaxID=36050 RepID=A0A1B8B6Z2_FUSPO|nr:hypothetical protein FPOAC1_002526 [Fusarium poae]KAG8676521.1 hypothetical protein FPOAC1_002526 [Fusarium poae]OBS28466.1 hypothetical protein FPOA_02404 [Fusarium poae]